MVVQAENGVKLQEIETNLFIGTTATKQGSQVVLKEDDDSCKWTVREAKAKPFFHLINNLSGLALDIQSALKSNNR